MVFQTVVSGVLVFILGQFFLEFILKPKLKYKEVIGKIDNKLKFFANVITKPGVLPPQVLEECANILRDLSCNLESTYKQLFWNQKNRDKNISEAAKLLINLSNSLYEKGQGLRNSDNLDRIRKLLYITEL